MAAVLHRLTLLLFATALALRLLIAPGMMPVATAHGVQMASCPGQMDPSGGEPAKSTCPFAAVAAPTVAPIAPALVWARLTPVALPIPVLTRAARGHGPPSWRPPSTGPPLLV